MKTDNFKFTTSNIREVILDYNHNILHIHYVDSEVQSMYYNLEDSTQLQHLKSKITLNNFSIGSYMHRNLKGKFPYMHLDIGLLFNHYISDEQLKDYPKIDDFDEYVAEYIKSERFRKRVNSTDKLHKMKRIDCNND